MRFESVIERFGPAGKHDAPASLRFRKFLVESHAVPQFFGDEREERVEGAQGMTKYEIKHRQAILLLRFGAAHQARLAAFQVPIAEFVPEKAMNGLGRVAEFILRQRTGQFLSSEERRVGQEW